MYDVYDDGQGVPQDYKKVFNWFEKAALQGKAKAQFNLGLIEGREKFPAFPSDCRPNSQVLAIRLGSKVSVLRI